MSFPGSRLTSQVRSVVFEEIDPIDYVLKLDATYGTGWNDECLSRDYGQMSGSLCRLPPKERAPIFVFIVDNNGSFACPGPSDWRTVLVEWDPITNQAFFTQFIGDVFEPYFAYGYVDLHNINNSSTWTGKIYTTLWYIVKRPFTIIKDISPPPGEISECVSITLDGRYVFQLLKPPNHIYLRFRVWEAVTS